jgi:hypothetical protein
MAFNPRQIGVDASGFGQAGQNIGFSQQRLGQFGINSAGLQQQVLNSMLRSANQAGQTRESGRQFDLGRELRREEMGLERERLDLARAGQEYRRQQAEQEAQLGQQQLLQNLILNAEGLGLTSDQLEEDTRQFDEQLETNQQQFADELQFRQARGNIEDAFRRRGFDIKDKEIQAYIDKATNDFILGENRINLDYDRLAQDAYYAQEDLEAKAADRELRRDLGDQTESTIIRGQDIDKEIAEDRFGAKNEKTVMAVTEAIGKGDYTTARTAEPETVKEGFLRAYQVQRGDIMAELEDKIADGNFGNLERGAIRNKLKQLKDLVNKSGNEQIKQDYQRLLSAIPKGSTPFGQYFFDYRDPRSLDLNVNDPRLQVIMELLNASKQ